MRSRFGERERLSRQIEEATARLYATNRADRVRASEIAVETAAGCLKAAQETYTEAVAEHRVAQAAFDICPIHAEIRALQAELGAADREAAARGGRENAVLNAALSRLPGAVPSVPSGVFTPVQGGVITLADFGDPDEVRAPIETSMTPERLL